MSTGGQFVVSPDKRVLMLRRMLHLAFAGVLLAVPAVAQEVNGAD
jgi:hypothetical protein